MADGAEMALDDYIKIKRRQGAFKVGRRGGVKAVPGGRGLKARRGKGRINLGRVQQGQQQNMNRNIFKRKGTGFFRNNNLAVGAGGKRFGPRGRNSRGGQQPQRQRNRRVQQNNISGVQQQQQRQGQARWRNVRNWNWSGAGGVSQNVIRRARQRFAARATVNIAATGGASRPRRGGNKRFVMKFARKRVQRARLQLANQRRVGFRPSFIPRRGRIQSVRPLMSITSGIRRTRNGFVTVSNPVERQLQRLVVKEKIQRARQTRLNRTYFNNSNTGGPSSSASNPGPSGMSYSRNYKPYPAYHHIPQRVAINDGRASLNHQYDRRVPPVGRSMYADHEQAVPSFRSSGPTPLELGFMDRRSLSPPFNFSRTTVNPTYDPTNPSIGFDGLRQRLNPDIQRKIQFIQTHGNRTEREPVQVIPDFRAPTVSSKMKLSDRFKLYMN